MLGIILAIAGLLAAAVLAFGTVFVVGVRMKWGFVLGPLFRVQRSMLNPASMRTAGKDGATYSVVRHRGRTSGRGYETPVGVVDTGGEFLVALPYGSQTNWVRNVLVGGSADIVHEGRTWSVDRPEIVPMRDVVDRFPASDRGAFRLFGVGNCLRLRKVGPVGDASASASS